jgi:hypothetical protein
MRPEKLGNFRTVDATTFEEHLRDGFEGIPVGVESQATGRRRFIELIVYRPADLPKGQECRCVALRTAIGQRRRACETKTSGHGRRDPGGLIQI